MKDEIEKRTLVEYGDEYKICVMKGDWSLLAIRNVPNASCGDAQKSNSKS